MYIWRGKNRRDTRHLKALGEKAWKPLTEDHHRNDHDEQLRCNEEEKFLKYFHDHTKELIENYLNTYHGEKEIEILRKKLDKIRKTQERFILNDEKEELKQELLYQNVEQIFKKFSLEEDSNIININGLSNLLNYLGVKMNKKQFQNYCNELKMTNNFPTVTFDEFYLHFLTHLNEREKNKLSVQAASFFSSVFRQIGSSVTNATSTLVLSSGGSDRQNLTRRYERQKKHQRALASGEIQKELTYEEKADIEESKKLQSVNVSYFIQLRLQEIEAKTLLVEHAIHHSLEIAKQEFRIAHPPKYICEQCFQCYPNYIALREHLKDKDYHVKYAKKTIYLNEKYDIINQLLYHGDLGRHLIAYRIIFHPDLGIQENRLKIVTSDPYRPSLSDPTSKRRQQLLRGMFVQGYDATMGIRPVYRQLNGLITQHLAAKRITPHSNTLFQVNHPILQDVIFDLMRCDEDFIDIVSIYDHPKSKILLQDKSEFNNHSGDKAVPYCFALLRFEWNGFSITTVKIKGEFTSWKEEEMLCDNDTSRFFIMKELPPGKYRYRFIVDGEERVNECLSYVKDPVSPIGYSNEVLVSSSPLVHITRPRTVPPSSAIIASPKHQLAKQSKENLSMKLPLLTTSSPQPPNDVMVTSNPNTGRRRKKKVVKVHPTSYNEGSDDDPSVTSQLSDGVEELLGNNDITRPPSLQIATTNTNTALGMIYHLSGEEKEAMIHRLESIELRNLAICDDGAWALAINIKRNSFIIHLDLSYNQLSDDGIQGLSSALPKLIALKTLKLNGNGFGYDGCRYLTAGLSTSETIQTIELCGNRLGDDGVEILCEGLLRHQDSIQYLYLDTCYIGDDGMECIKDMFLHNRCLLHLSIRNNSFTHLGMYSLLLGLKFNASLISLNVSENIQIGSLGTRSIGDLLFYNQTIQNIEMNQINMFSGHNLSGLSSLCYGIKKNTSLIRLSLQKNAIEEYHIIDLSDALLNNNRILVCDLSNNQIKNDLWFQRDVYIKTHLRPSQPSIATILYRNHLLLSKQTGGKTMKELFQSFTPPTHKEQLLQVEEWKTSKKLGLKSQKKHSKLLGLPSLQLPSSGENGENGDGRPFSPYRTPAFPFRSPIHSRATSPDYGQKKEEKIDENGNLRLSTDRRKNAILAISAPALDRSYVNPIVDDVKKGYWTTRKVWRRLPIDNQEKKNQEIARQLEYERIMTEKHFLKKQMKEYMSAMSLYLDELPCQEFLLSIAKVFTYYLHELSRVNDVRNKSHINFNKNYLADKYHDEVLLTSRRNPLEIPLLKNELLLKEQQEEQKNPKNTINQSMNDINQLKQQKNQENIIKATHNPLKSSSSSSSFFSSLSLFNATSIKPRTISINDIARKQFMNVHIAFTQALFMILSSGNKSLVLHPEKLEIAMNMITLPCQTNEQLQNVLDNTIVPSIERIGFHSFNQYILLNATKLSKNGPMKRSKLLHDLYYHPPLLEAKTMMMYYLSSKAYTVYRDHYRLNLLYTPKYCCHYCQERFSTEKELQKHISKDYYLHQHHMASASSGDEKEEGKGSKKVERQQNYSISTKKRMKKTSIHKRLILEQTIVESCHFIIKDINYYLTGVYFPAYYELLPNHLLPNDYFPQIFDRIGKAGRPLTVLESYRTIRAIDCLGEYLLVTIHGTQGWIRYRNGNRLYLRPIQGFHWEKLHIQETLTYYRINDNLPKNIEIKVRHRPQLDSEIIGYLHPGDIIQCYAVIDDWLQVKYQKEDAAWILFYDKLEEIVDKNGQIITNPSLIRQRKIDYTSKPTIVAYTEYDDAVDQSFDDTIITYEINGKVYKNDCIKHPEISSLKIHFFDFIRYGSVKYQTNLHHFLLIPYILQEKLLLHQEYYKEELNDQNPMNTFHHMVLQTPFNLTQKDIFHIIVNEMNDIEILQFFEDIDLLPPNFKQQQEHSRQITNAWGGGSKSIKNASLSNRHRRGKRGQEMILPSITSSDDAMMNKTVNRQQRLKRLPSEPMLGRLVEERRGSMKGFTGKEEDNNNDGDDEEEEEDDDEELKERIQQFFGQSLKSDIYGENANIDDVFDDIDLITL